MEETAQEVGMALDEAKARMERIFLHAQQVQAGLIPADSPPDFVRPEGNAALDERGLPWWFGPDYHPTPEALAEFSKPMNASDQDEEPDPEV